MKYDVFVRYEEGMKEETFYLCGTLPELADSLERYVKPFILELSEDQHLSIGQFISPTRYKSAKQLTKPIKLTLHAHIERPLKPEEERGDVSLPPEAREGISRNGQRTLVIPDDPVTFDMIPVRGRVKVIARCLDPALSEYFDALVAEFKNEWGEPAAEDGTGKKRGPTIKTQERAKVFKRLKDAHPEWNYDRVAMEAVEELGEVVTGEAVRNAYRAMRKAYPDQAEEWTWKRADRIR